MVQPLQLMQRRTVSWNTLSQEAPGFHLSHGGRRLRRYLFIFTCLSLQGSNRTKASRGSSWGCWTIRVGFQVRQSFEGCLHPFRRALWLALLLLPIGQVRFHLRSRSSSGMLGKVLGSVLCNAPEIPVDLGGTWRPSQKKLVIFTTRCAGSF